jgi:hypothetical protein
MGGTDHRMNLDPASPHGHATKSSPSEELALLLSALECSSDQA